MKKYLFFVDESPKYICMRIQQYCFIFWILTTKFLSDGFHNINFAFNVYPKWPNDLSWPNICLIKMTTNY